MSKLWTLDRINLGFALILVAFGVYCPFQLHHLLRDAEARLAGTAQIGAVALQDHLSRTIDDTERSLLALDSVCPIIEPLSANREKELHRQLSEVVERLPQIGSAIIVGLSGSIVAEANRFPTNGRHVGDRAYVTAHAEDGPRTLFIAPPITSRLSGEVILAASLPLLDGGQHRCAIASLALDPTYFKQFFTRILGDSPGTITLKGADGTVLVRVPAESGPARLDDDPARISVARTTERTPLTIDFTIDRTAIRQVWMHDATGFIAAATGFLLLLALAWWQAIRQHRDLRLREQRLNLALRGANLGTWDWMIDSGHVTVNARWAEIIGHTIEDVAPHLSSWERLIHPEDIAGVMHSLNSHLQGRTEFYQSEHRLRHKAGHWVWVLDAGCVVERFPDGRAKRASGIHSDISERKAIETDLKRSNADLEQFGYVVAHDLREPLRMIGSYIRLLQRRLGGSLDDEGARMMDFVVDGAGRMDRMLKALLDYSLLGSIPSTPERISSHRVIADALSALAPATTEADAEIVVSGDWPEVTARRGELTRLFQNLIGNAIKFRDPTGRPQVTVSATPLPDSWLFIVADNGIGIAHDQIDRLFKVFQRLNPRDSYDGIGIGLALCRKIVERHGGRIWVETSGPGQGCRFCFTLPKAEAGRGRE